MQQAPKRHGLCLQSHIRGITNCPPACFPTKKGGCLVHCSTFVCSTLGLRMDNNSIHVAVGLHLGSALCIPHDCALCGAQVDEIGVHALSCHKSKGRLARRSYLNDIIKRALTAVDIPCALEPRGLCRGDSRHPDRISIIPWEQVRCLVWDATCHDTFAPTNVPFSSKGTGFVANRAAASKRLLYSGPLSILHHPISSGISRINWKGCPRLLA